MESLPIDSGMRTVANAETEIHAVDADPYRSFPLAQEDREPVPPLQALLAAPETAGCLRDDAGVDAWTPGTFRRSGLRLLVFLLILLPLLALPGWNMFAAYAPPPPADTPKPLPFDGDLPLAYRERIRDINNDIRAGNRWRPAFNRLQALSLNAGDMPPELRAWVNGELLVVLASGEISPDEHDAALPDRAFADLRHAVETAPGAAIPFRPALAYAAILRARSDAAAKSGRPDARLAPLLERIRNDHPALADGNDAFLAMEAEEHIAAFPAEYTPGDRRLEYHWRRSSHAIERLYALSGARDARVRGLDRKRWEAVHRFFDFTLLTLDMDRLGRLHSVRLGGRDYSRDDIQAILKQL